MKAGCLGFIALLFSCALFAQSTASSKLTSISGTVIDSATGQVVAKAAVVLRVVSPSSDKDESKSATTDPTGHYELPDIRPGEYYLSVSKTGYLNGGYGRRLGRNGGTPISVSEGKSLAGMDIKIQRGAVISGRVLDEDGEPFPNVQVMALQYLHMGGKRRMMPVGQAQTDDRGEYRVHDLAPGNYYVSCHVDARRSPVVTETDGKKAYAATYYPGVTAVDAATAVAVTAGSEGIANFSLAPSAAFTVRGKIVGAGENSMISVMVMPAENPFGAGLSPTFAKDKSFELNGVLPGSYGLTAISYDEGKQIYASRKITVSDADLNDVTISFKNATFEIRGALQVLGDQKPELTGIYLGLTGPSNHRPGG